MGIFDVQSAAKLIHSSFHVQRTLSFSETNSNGAQLLDLSTEITNCWFYMSDEFDQCTGLSSLRLVYF